MRPVFGDSEFIRFRDYKSKKLQPTVVRYLSDCCGDMVKQICDWEYPKGGFPGVTLVTTCMKCKKNCIVEKKLIY